MRPPALAAAGVQVLHVQGKHGEAEPAPRPADGPPYVVVDFVDRMDLAYAAADAVVCRAGCQHRHRGLRASGCRRSSCRCRSATASRRSTPSPVVDAGGGLLVADADLTADWVRGARARPARRTPTGCAAMGAAAAGLIPLDADEKLARIVLEAARGQT